MLWAACSLGLFLVSHSALTKCAQADEPRVLLPGAQLEQIAREPEIVTPVGMAFDAQGRLLVVESHTHQRTENYEGPKSDRVRMLSGFDKNGRNGQWHTFAEGFRHAMNVAIHPQGGVYLVTRSDVHLLRDTNGNNTSDVDDPIVRLETTVDYPHNALSGIVVDGDYLYLGVGENFGVPYTLVGSDGTKIKNVGGVGTIYKCKLDGSKIERYAEGFWNPFSLCMARGHLFCVDNDPDASPPCRLIDVIAGGDYGFRFEYGRAGVHPLQAWNGELPGTLPMVCGTGEAPTAIVFHRGYLWVTSWGDYRIESYRLTPQSDGKFNAQRTVVVQGDADFRPTGMAIAPDGSLWFGDWVDRSYPVHGKGRIWRLTLPEQLETEFKPITIHRAPVDESLKKLHALRWGKNLSRDELILLLKESLHNSDPDVQLYALRWIAEEHLTELKPDVEQLLENPAPTERYFLAVLAAVDWLGREPEQRRTGIADGLLARELRNPQRSDEIKALALELMSPDYKDLTLESLSQLVNSPYKLLQIAAVKTLAQQSNDERFALLLEIAKDEKFDDTVRVEAVAGLAAKASENKEFLTQLAAGTGDLAKEAERILRLSGLTPLPLDDKPDSRNIGEWVKLLAEKGDAESGRRLFFSAVGPRCGMCHRFAGRGGEVGPDLTQVSASNSRERVITSILDPNREVAPHYETWVLITDDGKSHIGQRLPKGGDDGLEPYSDITGKRFELKSETILHREPSKSSIMPAGLEKSLTVEDLRDLVTFLME